MARGERDRRDHVRQHDSINSGHGRGQYLDELDVLGDVAGLLPDADEVGAALAVDEGGVVGGEGLGRVEGDEADLGVVGEVAALEEAEDVLEGEVHLRVAEGGAVAVAAVPQPCAGGALGVVVDALQVLPCHGAEVLAAQEASTPGAE